ncbi:MAG: laccase domain-containing protein [Candidatus Parcubacteria bacterium]|nr:laccase domain-containing protein [Candidatus Paceibacterota bacterium]
MNELNLWRPSNIIKAGTIGKNLLPNDGLLFDGRWESTDERGPGSLLYAIDVIYEVTGHLFEPCDIFIPRVNNGTNILTDLKNFEVNKRGVNVSVPTADGIIVLNDDVYKKKKLIRLGASDCGPLLWRGKNSSGIIHVAHGGFFQEVNIIDELFKLLKEIEGLDLGSVQFALGPTVDRLLFPASFHKKNIPSKFHSFVDELIFLDPEDPIRIKTFDSCPSSEKKLLVYFTSLIVKYLIEVHGVNSENICNSNIDTANCGGNLPSEAFFSRRRDPFDDKLLRDLHYGNNLSFIAT